MHRLSLLLLEWVANDEPSEDDVPLPDAFRDLVTRGYPERDDEGSVRDAAS